MGSFPPRPAAAVAAREAARVDASPQSHNTRSGEVPWGERNDIAREPTARLDLTLGELELARWLLARADRAMDPPRNVSPAPVVRARLDVASLPVGSYCVFGGTPAQEHSLMSAWTAALRLRPSGSPPSEDDRLPRRTP